MQQNKTKKISRTFVVRKFLGWLAIRLSVLIVFFVLLESVYRFGGLAAFGDANVEIIYGTIQKILFSLTVWFFLATSKKIIIPATIISVSPALGKIVRDRISVQKTNKTIARYLTYLIYFISILSLILIWAYSSISHG